jgi:hypothetical protein
MLGSVRQAEEEAVFEWGTKLSCRVSSSPSACGEV